MKATVIHHSADYDGIFCREIARKFRPDAKLIGWDFGQPLIEFPPEGFVYVMDLPPDCLKTFDHARLIWIDHHATAIRQWSASRIAGYRIDGVAACRLAWQWFTRSEDVLPWMDDFKNRKVEEPYAVTLAGEYDVWDHGPSNDLDVTFQFGLDCRKHLDWDKLLKNSSSATHYVYQILIEGGHARECYAKRDADIVRQRGFNLHFEGLNFIALNTARCNSQSFLSGVHAGHDGCLAFYWNGTKWVVSMYGVEHKPDVDLSVIAVKYGGGGHKQACGFQAENLPWLVRPLPPYYCNAAANEHYGIPAELAAVCVTASAGSAHPP